MQRIEFIKPYKFAHRGVEVEEFGVGDIVDASDELARSALDDKVAKPSKKQTAEEAEAEAERQAAEKAAAEGERAAPKNKADASAPETK